MNISEQVKELRRYCVELKKYGGQWNERLACKIKEAADIMESLSAKLADMERSAEDCSGGWILTSEQMPEENEEVICCFKSGIVEALVLFNCKFHGKVYVYEKSDIIAWQPLPEPYRGAKAVERTEKMKFDLLELKTIEKLLTNRINADFDTDVDVLLRKVRNEIKKMQSGAQNR